MNRFDIQQSNRFNFDEQLSSAGQTTQTTSSQPTTKTNVVSSVSNFITKFISEKIPEFILGDLLPAPLQIAASMQPKLQKGEGFLSALSSAVKEVYTPSAEEEVKLATEAKPRFDKLVSGGMSPEIAKYLTKSLVPQEQVINMILGFSGGELENIKTPKKIKVPGEVSSKNLIPAGEESLKGETTKGISELAKKENILPQQSLPKKPITSLTGESTPQYPNKVPQANEVSTYADIINSENESVKKITQLIKEAKPASKELKALQAEERSTRVGQAATTMENVKGQEGYYAALNKLKGNLTEDEARMFQSVNNALTKEDVNNLFNIIQKRNDLDFFQKLNTQTGLTKVLNGRIPTEGELNLLDNVFPKEFTDAILSKRTILKKALDAGIQLANVPRSIMSSFDLSAPFRQGLYLINHPKQFFGAFKDMFKAFASEGAYNDIVKEIATRPTYKLMEKNGLALTDVKRFLTNREEQFMSGWAEKIPVIGKVVKASGRAYTAFLDKLRADVFDKLIAGAEKAGRNIAKEPDLVKQIADFVNTFSGRGNIKSLQKGAQLLNGIFFSPRLAMSRVKILFSPLFYAKADPFVRKEALKSLLTVTGAGMTMLGLASAGGAKVGTDPRSSDFGKIIIGKTRIDIWGGLQQYVRMAAQLITGQYVSSTSGKTTTLGEGYKPLTRFDILLRQIESKEAPVASFISDLLKGQDYTGQPISLVNEVVQRFIPMALQDMYDIASTDPELLPVGALGFFGVGLQTYLPTKTKSGNRFNF